MNIPAVAIIGLPNSGKSTFFNKVIGLRKALTYPEAGTTRDRAYALTSWNGIDFYLIDTAGLARPGSELERNIQKQTEIAQEEADLILFVVDGKTPPSSQDFATAQKLYQTKKPIILVCNKIDARNQKAQEAILAYSKLGIGNPSPISSLNGSGVGDLLDEIVKILKEQFGEIKADFSDHIKIAFLGKPNVGKSSLINALLKQDRLLVDSKAGTTRSTVEIPFEFNGTKFLLLDTAGIKRRWKQDADVETAAASQSLFSLNNTDVALLVIDAAAEITVQDQAIADKIIEAQKSVVVLLNKSDMLSEEEQQKLLDRLPDYLAQLWWAPVVFTSAKNNLGLDLMLKFAQDVYNKSFVKVDQKELDKFLADILSEHRPGKMEDQRAPKFYSLKQIGNNPPTFKFTVNFPAAIAESWKKYFEKQFRLKFGYEGNSIIIKYIRKQ